ncbi:nicotinate-nucleotide adenylyltransferase [Glaciimonas immobilis]|uniref:Probable nicotinate-nucleotide adenylyltransferase n=1 Tax=Glaciimonas immobilis TaxID=728004 RepID=A0A840RVJ6_9BURK|nr:nicotinate-nucleotide adenylyltransferase [Glaciimonas immobilis]KAF3999967.1 nicotinate-nucleotide adenylyltransferase [Glaciimonas immobilis]MBB5200469.1 nicotinate-nucleotide adenylyltransferase [Glaciimonas immobilis]
MRPEQPPRRCIAVLGGSFDPVHNGHVALGHYFVTLLAPDMLRVIPAGNPWQKHGLEAGAADRVEMVRRAFNDQAVAVLIDQQEIERQTATFTIDTLQSLRTELGPDASIIFLMGADQLQHLNTWQGWDKLFNYAHLGVASRPGFALDASQVPPEVTREFTRRAATPEQIRQSPHGLTYLAENLFVDISATKIRAALHSGNRPDSLIPAVVLDYIEQHHLYKN